MKKWFCWIISHKFPFLISTVFPQTWFGNKDTSNALCTPHNFTTTMPRRSRKLLFLYCADHRRNKYVVQSHPETLCWRTWCLHLNHFSGSLPIWWKALENTECFFPCACRAPSPVTLGPRWDLCTLLWHKQQWQFGTGQGIHFSGKTQVTEGCSELFACV